MFAVQLVVLGLLMRLDVFAFLAGLAWPFVLLLGLLMAILLLGALVGWPLMWATVSVEGTDAFDALSRSYAYTYQRPWRLLWYVLFVGRSGGREHVRRQSCLRPSAIALGDWSIDWGLDERREREIDPTAGDVGLEHRRPLRCCRRRRRRPPAARPSAAIDERELAAPRAQSVSGNR